MMFTIWLSENSDFFGTFLQEGYHWDPFIFTAEKPFTILLFQSLIGF